MPCARDIYSRRAAPRFQKRRRVVLGLIYIYVYAVAARKFYCTIIDGEIPNLPDLNFIIDIGIDFSTFYYYRKVFDTIQTDFGKNKKKNWSWEGILLENYFF